MKGLVEEGKELLEEGESGPVLDAALIGAAQRVEHYEIAAYGCLRTYAQLLGLQTSPSCSRIPWRTRKRLTRS